MRKLHVVTVNGTQIGFAEKKHAAQLLSLIPNSVHASSEYFKDGNGNYKDTAVEGKIECSYEFKEVVKRDEFEKMKS